ncbi:molybdopterin oxidoreductase Fe4S4 region [Ammonifex degensii KC4]|uniref:Molybdopterin oxidoreductase Fe4S4 region n=1 Tax=Ammonifex degensii (strain DSM 10501 / KC4) TaxID=429009 RepID=C9R7N2_AMMDK|nr:molybdopterin oxidoreductase Fe4S4 region [Ammonifex degensii]ACX52311.1 molybdopterin oxidoreductase Fe4S4 region [Ammonifex degensii KC4]
MKKVSRRDFLRSLGGILSGILWAEEEGEAQEKEELTEKKEYPALCPFCTKGCGLIFTVRKERILGFEGDPDHPANAGRVCDEGLERLRSYLEAQNWSSPLLYCQSGTEKWEVREWTQAWPEIVSWLKERGPVAFFWRQELFSNEESFLLAQVLNKLGAAGRREGFNLSWDGWFPPSIDKTSIFKRKGVLIWGGDLLPDEPEEEVEWLVLGDWLLSELYLETLRGKVRRSFPRAEVYLLPLASPWSREGSWISSGRWVQWVEKAVPPRENERAPLWLWERLWREMGWEEREFSAQALAQEISRTDTPLKGYWEGGLLRRRRLKGEEWGFPLLAK